MVSTAGDDQENYGRGHGVDRTYLDRYGFPRTDTLT